MNTDLADLAYSYLRFSSPAQADGDSIRRQTAARDGWLRRHPEVKLDTTLKLADEGVSGYRGKHRTNRKHALAQFCDMVQRGRIPRGSYLLIENMDRLSREKPVQAVNLLTNLLLAGVRVVQLLPDEIELDEDSDLFSLLRGQLSQNRGHDESKRKEGTLGAVWGSKKQEARDSKTPISTMCPAWLELVGVRRTARGNDYSQASYRIKEDAARAVRRIFELCINGLGTFAIMQRLNAEEIAPIGRSGEWERSFVKKILKSPAVYGTYIPGKGSDRTPDGMGPVVNYYPAVIDEATFDRAAKAMKARERKTGHPTSEGVCNPFSGLLRNATDGEKLHVSGTRGYKYLVSAGAIQKHTGAEWRTFPLAVFVTALLKELRELKATSLFSDPSAAKVTELEARQSEVAKRLSVATAKWDADPESPTWASQVDKYDKEHRSLLKEIAEARREAANPLTGAWAEIVGLIAENDPERLRAALLGTIDGIWCLFVGGWTRTRIAAVQVFFKGGESRSYLVRYQIGDAHRKGYWQVRSWTDEELRKAKLGAQFDLRSADPTCLGEDDEGHSAWAAGWANMETYLQSLSVEDLDNVVFGECPRHPLP